MMHQIYTRASGVIAWLGDSDDGSDLAMQCIADPAHEDMRTTPRRLRCFTNPQGHPGGTDKTCTKAVLAKTLDILGDHLSQGSRPDVWSERTRVVLL